MSLEADIYKLLTTTHFGSSAPAFGTRAYPAVAPENVTYPCAIYDLSSAEFEKDLGGDGLIDTHYYTVVVMTRQMKEAENETELIKSNLHGFSGASFASGVGSVSSTTTLANNIRGIFVSAGSSYHNTDTHVYMREVDLEIHIKRT